MRYLKLGLMALSIISSLIACQKAEETQLVFDENIFHETDLVGEFVTTEGQTVLGDVIDIPYSIENLLKAYENLPAQTKSQINPEDIQPTHYYVRFYPKSIEEQDILRNIKPYVFLSETPLDRKVVVGGSSYHDPSIPEDLPTFQYTVVPVARWTELEKTVPVEAEILIEAYIPDYDEAYTTKSEEKYGIPTYAYEALLQEAYRITGNEFDVIPETKSSWNPSGRIRAYDDAVVSYVPIKGVRVRGTHLLKVKETLTDGNGCFTLPSFNNPVNLKVIWESDLWDVRDGLIGQATFDGPQLNGQYWYCDIGTLHEKNIRFAAMHRAAYRYYYDDCDGLVRPVSFRKEKLCFIDDIGSGDSMSNMGLGVLPDMRVYGKNSSTEYRDTQEVFKSTAHEFGHLAHCLWVEQINYWNTDLIVKESWSEFVEYILTTLEYTSLGVTNLTDIVDDRQQWTPAVGYVNYSPFFIDFYDTYNQGANNTTYLNDELYGYTSNVLNQSVLASFTLEDVKDYLDQVKPYYITSQQIESYYSFYASL